MKRVTYRGNADVRQISAEDWKRVGVDAKDVEWRGAGDVQELANAAAEHLARYEPLDYDVEDVDVPEGAVEAHAAAKTAGDVRRLDDLKREREAKTE